jgi:hypothetical protein
MINRNLLPAVENSDNDQTQKINCGLFVVKWRMGRRTKTSGKTNGGKYIDMKAVTHKYCIKLSTLIYLLVSLLRNSNTLVVCHFPASR